MKQVQLFSLVYASSATRVLDDADLEAILASSRRWNRRVELTGLLLFSDGNFMQALEGDERVVRARFRTIKNDKRHGDVRVLSAGPIVTREFGDWAMGFRRIATSPVAALNGESDFLSNSDVRPSWPTATPARVLLDWFRLHSSQNDAPQPPTVTWSN